MARTLQEARERAAARAASPWPAQRVAVIDGDGSTVGFAAKSRNTAGRRRGARHDAIDRAGGVVRLVSQNGNSGGPASAAHNENGLGVGPGRISKASSSARRRARRAHGRKSRIRGQMYSDRDVVQAPPKKLAASRAIAGALRTAPMLPTVAPAAHAPAGAGIRDERAPPAAAADVCGQGLVAPGAPPSVAVRPSGETLPRGTYDPNGRWVVETLAMGDNSVDTNGLALAPRRVHGSVQARAAHENFHPIHWDGDIFECARDGAIRLPTYPIPGSSAERCTETPMCLVPAARGSRQDSSCARKDVVAGHVLEFMRRRPGVAVIVAGIGARPGVNWSASDLVDHPSQPMATSAMHDCVVAALVNAVFAVCGEAAALHVQSVAQDSVFLSLKALGNIMDRARGSVTKAVVHRHGELQRAIQSWDRLAAFKELAAMTRGIFVVRLRQDGLVDHAVVVDATNKIIIDSEERMVIKLSAINLAKCGVIMRWR